jgi:hypothetical protein
MNDAEWLRDWCSEHINVTAYGDKKEAAELASHARIDAKENNKSIKKALKEFGHHSLTEYMLSVLNERADDEVDRLVGKDD